MIRSITIMGQKWKYRLMADDKYMAEHGDDSEAITVSAKRLMDFRESAIKMGVVRHEVRHAFTNELCLDSADLTASQMEEIQCTLDQTRWESLDRAAKRIFKNLKKGIEKKK